MLLIRPTFSTEFEMFGITWFIATRTSVNLEVLNRMTAPSHKDSKLCLGRLERIVATVIKADVSFQSKLTLQSPLGCKLTKQNSGK